MISASGEVGISVMMELRQPGLDGIEMPNKKAKECVNTTYKGKGDVKNCVAYR